MAETLLSSAQNTELLGVHLEGTLSRWRAGMQKTGYDQVLVAAGESDLYFLDDHGPHFKANPYFNQWVDPAFVQPGAVLLLSQNHPPQLFMPQPVDYWHAVAEVPAHLQTLSSPLDVHTFSDAKSLLEAVQQATAGQGRTAFIGRDQGNEMLGEHNPQALLDYLNYHRAVKSDYELAVMRGASVRGAQGHLAAEAAFRAGGSEFDVHIEYLRASEQSEVDLPYSNIVAINRHAAILHYNLQDRTLPGPSLSLLIDAGAQVAGYASDITRTYVQEGAQHESFAALLARMEEHQGSILEAVRPGITFADLHDLMHRSLAEVLTDAGLVSCSAQAAYEQGLTRIFCPHGLGHLLGLQVHDAGGHLGDEDGTPAPPAEKYPTLRFTRQIEENQVFTIEPGLYFIESLLVDARREQADLNWEMIDALAPYGGIRIEDNVRVLADGIENLTRDAWTQVLSAS